MYDERFSAMARKGEGEFLEWCDGNPYVIEAIPTSADTYDNKDFVLRVKSFDGGEANMFVEVKKRRFNSTDTIIQRDGVFLEAHKFFNLCKSIYGGMNVRYVNIFQDGTMWCWDLEKTLLSCPNVEYVWMNFQTANGNEKKVLKGVIRLYIKDATRLK